MWFDVVNMWSTCGELKLLMLASGPQKVTFSFQKRFFRPPVSSKDFNSMQGAFPESQL